MRKILFYMVLISIWVVMVLAYALLLVLLGLDPNGTAFGFYGRLGAACVCPEMWIIALGVAMLLRKRLARLILRKDKKFNTAPAILCIILGVLGLLWMGFVKYTSYVTQKEAIELYQENHE